MSDQKAKYMIHATIKAEGTIQRKDVVGAIFGQTEGLLGEELQLREQGQGFRYDSATQQSRPGINSRCRSRA